MRSLFVLTLLVSVECAHTQTTWQGLAFGMNHQQVRETLAARGFSLHGAADAPISVAEPDVEVKTNTPTLSLSLKAPFATAPVFFKPQLTFDDKGGLKAVRLLLDQDKTLQTTPALQPMGIVLFIAGTSIYEQLTGKYGSPVAKRGPCDNISPADLVGSAQDCSVKWKDSAQPGQTIELFWSWSGLVGRPQKLVFFILYSSPASSDL
jgi:hypothetical protein